MRYFKTPNNAGQSIILMLVLITFLTGGLLFAGKTFTSERTRVSSFNEQLIATAYATELIEFFRAYNSREMKMRYLNSNPTTGSTVAADGYYACAHINLLDRSANKIINEDPIAALPPTVSLSQANRFYQVHLVNQTSMNTFIDSYCNYKWPQIQFPFETATADTLLGPTSTQDRFFVTVFVTWVPQGKTTIQQVALSTLLPD